jgi:hypothetical protein
MTSPNSYFNWKSNNNKNQYDVNYSSWTYKKTNKNFIKYSAGILPYTFDQSGKLLFLLGKDNDNDWSDFGGRCELKDHNEPINTASREFYEETLGAVMDISDCNEKLSNGKPIKIISKTLNGSPYYMFLLYVEYLDYPQTFNKTSNFLKYHYSSTSISGIHKIIEKSSIRWVTIDTLLNCIDNKDSNPISLRGVFYKTIENFKEDIIQLLLEIQLKSIEKVLSKITNSL